MDDKDNGAGRTADQRVAAVHLQRRLQAIVDDTVELRLNHNTSTLLTVRKPRGPLIPWRFNLHVMFLHADDGVLRALPAYAQGDKEAADVLRRFIDANMHRVAKHARVARLNLRPRGAHHDLHELARGVNDEFFGGNLSVYITWGQERRAPARSGRSRVRHIRFGSYDHHTNLIRIHPALDRTEVPELFVRFVIYHEMLHAALAPETDDATGRRVLHPPEFEQMERLFPQYHEAMAFEQRFLREFL